MPFTLLEYVVRVANNIRSKFSEFSIDCNTNLHKMAQECTPEVTLRQMKFLTALREKGHCTVMLCCMIMWSVPALTWLLIAYSVNYVF